MQGCAFSGSRWWIITFRGQKSPKTPILGASVGQQQRLRGWSRIMVKQFQAGGRAPFCKSLYRHISAINHLISMKFCTQQQILNWMNVTWSKMKKVALDRFRVRQNVFLVYTNFYAADYMQQLATRLFLLPQPGFETVYHCMWLHCHHYKCSNVAQDNLFTTFYQNSASVQWCLSLQTLKIVFVTYLCKIILCPKCKWNNLIW